MIALAIILFVVTWLAGYLLGRMAAAHELNYQRRQAGEWFAKWQELRDDADWWKEM